MFHNAETGIHCFVRFEATTMEQTAQPGQRDE